MDISIQKKPGFIIAGYKMEAIDSSLCPQAWEKLFEQIGRASCRERV